MQAGQALTDPVAKFVYETPLPRPARPDWICRCAQVVSHLLDRSVRERSGATLVEPPSGQDVHRGTCWQQSVQRFSASTAGQLNTDRIRLIPKIYEHGDYCYMFPYNYDTTQAPPWYIPRDGMFTPACRQKS